MNQTTKGSLMTAGMTLIGFGTNFIVTNPAMWQGYAVTVTGIALLFVREYLKIDTKK